ncbi:MAG: hypothetical protein R2856_11345 [Caldilineaceae bacterium]
MRPPRIGITPKLVGTGTGRPAAPVAATLGSNSVCHGTKRRHGSAQHAYRFFTC